MAENPVSELLKKTKAAGTDVVPESAAVKGNMENVNAYKAAYPATSPAPKPAPAPAKPSPVDKVNPTNRYGTGKGEKTPAQMNAEFPGLPKMHTGGTVMHSGPHNLQKGERVLTKDQHSKLTAAMGLATDALSHDAKPEPEPEMPKHLKEMHIKELHTGGFHITKHSGRPGDESTTHGAPDNDSVVAHFMDHMGHPDEDEEDVEAGNHDMDGGKMAAEKAIGLK